MGQELWQLRQELIRQLLEGTMRPPEVAQRLGCSLGAGSPQAPGP